MKRLAVTGLGMIFGLTLVWAGEAVESKASYVKKADTEVQEWTAKLNSLQQRSQQSGAHTREVLDREIKSVDEKLNEARQKLDHLRSSNENSWKNFRAGVERALQDVKRCYRKAASLFEEKEKP